MAIVVKADPGDSTGQLIKKFKKIVQLDELLTTIKEKEFYKKPSVIKKEKMSELRRRQKRRNRIWQGK